MTPLIRSLRSELRALLRKTWPSYTVPGLWVGSREPVTFPSAPAYLLHQFQVVDAEEKRRRHRPWSLTRALAYNGMVRHITSYNHGDGTSESGWRTSGTFLKLAALLPYLVRLDVDLLVLQPVTEVGKAGMKGGLGSPYAVKHPWHLEPALGEPAVSFSLEDQARILVEMCHALGIRVVVESVLRTASLDSSMVPMHPEWFYWVDEGLVGELPDGFTSPTFEQDQLEVMKDKVERGVLTDLPEPPDSYQQLFTPPPLRVEADGNRWRGIGPKHRIVRIPGAFADWPPDDSQPAWSDVTYLRLHDHPQYRYMAYNTLRMYERVLDTEEHRQHPLWNTIASIIPYYIRTLYIDGAMIDMGHALPRDLRRRVMREARSLRSDFIMFEENFNASAASVDDGYDAAIGQLPLSTFSYDEIKAYVQRLTKGALPQRCFATPESHNTKRAMMHWKSEEAVGAVWTLLRVLPGGLGFIHAGIELGETTPVNTGLGFTAKELADFPPERLPLFSDVPLQWDHHSPVMQSIVRTGQILHGSSFWDHATDHDHVVLLATKKPCLAFLRLPTGARQGLLCVVNLSPKPLTQRIAIPPDSGVMFLAPNAYVKRTGTKVSVELAPWQAELVFTLH